MADYGLCVRSDRGRRQRENAIAQCLGREKIGVDVEGGADLGKRPLGISCVDGSARRAQPRLKSLPGFTGIHTQLSCKMSSVEPMCEKKGRLTAEHAESAENSECSSQRSLRTLRLDGPSSHAEAVISALPASNERARAGSGAPPPAVGTRTTNVAP